MIVLDVLGCAILYFLHKIYREVKATADRQRALYKTQALHRFK